jgi:hypothetical protein
MTTSYPYIILATSNASKTKRFMVAEGGYAPNLTKAQNEQHTIDGVVDGSQGAIYGAFIYQLKVYETLLGGMANDYGTIWDLQDFYVLNNPNGTPSDVLTLTDHFGNAHDVLFMGQLAPQPLSVILSGDNALYFYKVEFHEIQYGA